MYSNKQIVKIGYPILLSLVAQNIIQVVDTAFLGRVGEVELGASALAGVIYIAIYTIGFGFSMGSQILIGRRNGAQEYGRIGEIVIQGLLFLFVPAVLLITAFKMGLTETLMRLFQSESVGEAVTEYLDWRVYGFIFSFANSIFRAFYIGIARTKVLTANALIMAVVNVILDYGLIFGNLGLPEMGIGGAALASVIAEASSTLFFVLYTRSTVNLKRYGFNKFTFDWGVVKKVLSISIYMMMQYGLSIGTWFVFFMLIENNLGERSLAVSNIVRSLYLIVTIPSTSLGSAVNTMVSNTMGANRREEVLGLIKRVVSISFLAMMTLVLIMAIFPRLMIRIYTSDVLLIEDTVFPLYVLLTSLPFYAVGAVLFNAVSGTGNTRQALIFEVVTLVWYGVYMWFIIVRLGLPVAWTWTTEHVYWLQLALYSFIYLRSKKWMNKRL